MLAEIANYHLYKLPNGSHGSGFLAIPINSTSTDY
jgi:hypothetical protein